MSLPADQGDTRDRGGRRQNAASDEGMWIYVVPYLELPRGLALGDGYAIAPIADITADDPHLDSARAVLAMYTKPASRSADESGAVVLRDGRLGPEIPEQDLRRIGRGLGFGLLEANPRAEAAGYTDNSGHRAWTSENAFLRGHRVSGDGIFVWAHNGIRSTQTVSGRLGETADVVPLPAGVEIPMMAAAPDRYVTALTWRALGSGTQRSRRIGQAIDWLLAAWQNAELTADTRISNLHSGFDALLGDDDETQSGAHPLRAALCRLLDDPNTPTTHQWLVPRRGSVWEGQVSERGVWIFEFVQLRNGVAHGYAVERNEYLYNGNHHVNRAETELRLAVLASIAAELECPALRISERFSRLLEFITEDATRALDVLGAGQTDDK